jgi:hypothetical protein
VALEDSAAGAAAALAAGLPTVVTRSRYSLGQTLPSPAAGCGGLLADLDQLGAHGQPAQGLALGQAWQGLVDLGTLRHWLRPAAGGGRVDHLAANAAGAGFRSASAV